MKFTQDIVDIYDFTKDHTDLLNLVSSQKINLNSRLNGCTILDFFLMTIPEDICIEAFQHAIKYKNFSITYSNENNLLFKACKENKEDVALLLIDNCAVECIYYINNLFEGNTILHMASINKLENVISKITTYYGIDTTIINNDKKTALYYVCENNDSYKNINENICVFLTEKMLEYNYLDMYNVIVNAVTNKLYGVVDKILSHSKCNIYTALNHDKYINMFELLYKSEKYKKYIMEKDNGIIRPNYKSSQLYIIIQNSEDDFFEFFDKKNMDELFICGIVDREEYTISLISELMAYAYNNKLLKVIDKLAKYYTNCGYDYDHISNMKYYFISDMNKNYDKEMIIYILDRITNTDKFINLFKNIFDEKDDEMGLFIAGKLSYGHNSDYDEYINLLVTCCKNKMWNTAIYIFTNFLIGIHNTNYSYDLKRRLIDKCIDNFLLYMSIEKEWKSLDDILNILIKSHDKKSYSYKYRYRNHYIIQIIDNIFNNCQWILAEKIINYYEDEIYYLDKTPEWKLIAKKNHKFNIVDNLNNIDGYFKRFIQYFHKF